MRLRLQFRSLFHRSAKRNKRCNVTPQLIAAKLLRLYEETTFSDATPTATATNTAAAAALIQSPQLVETQEGKKMMSLKHG